MKWTCFGLVCAVVLIHVTSLCHRATGAASRHLKSPVECYLKYHQDHCKTQQLRGDYYYGECFDPVKQLCCGIKVLPKPNASYKCCDGVYDTYNFETHKCCNGKIVPKSYLPCGKDCFHPDNATCCRGVLYTAGLGCCGTRAIDPENDLCCAFKIHKGQKHTHKCNGQKSELRSPRPPSCPVCVTVSGSESTQSQLHFCKNYHRDSADFDRLAMTYSIVLDAKVALRVTQQNSTMFSLTRIRDSRRVPNNTSSDYHYKHAAIFRNGTCCKSKANIVLDNECASGAILKSGSRIFVMTNNTALLTEDATMLGKGDLLMVFQRDVKKRLQKKFKRKLKRRMF
ncbi:uncharacterized protein LOC106161842 isoform X2 [Lingula anatina]|uniref:Uncharacterized protein LOC106161842 isoform X2 n=1 Tax=Lingula anatina TaxID=7574 RepID=A0A1S3I7W1_LINAN|nr:uncharacterized protein LOC106161842 isoform X2 [Lingula anatina]|eukprot:XP_013394355.1 uncharacterized protein LOC106161842 isoform X2 [Lingula anatina]